MGKPTLFISRAGAMRHALKAVQRGRCTRVTIQAGKRHAHTRNSDFGFEISMFGKAGQFVGMV